MNGPGWGHDLLDRLLGELVRSIDGGLGAGLSVASDGVTVGLAAVGSARRWDEAQRTTESGPLAQALAGEQVLVVERFDLDEYPALAAQMRSDPDVPAALVLVPGAWVDQSRLVTTLYLADAAEPGHVETVGRYEPLLANAYGMLEFCGEAEMKAEQMLSMMQFRRVIEQAKGMVMSRRSMGADEAFTALAETSQHHNVRLRELAAALVEQVGSAPVEQPADPAAHVHPDDRAVEAAKLLWVRLTP